MFMCKAQIPRIRQFVSTCTGPQSSRCFSSYGNSYAGGDGKNYGESVRSYPQYTVFGENCLLSLKILLPSFRISRNNVLSLDNSKKGRILLEFVPRLADGTTARDQHIRFGLSAEEVGLLLDQLPSHEVELSRRSPPPNGELGLSASASLSSAPAKVLRITPGEGGTTTYCIDHETDGVGGQIPFSGSNNVAGPLEVTVHLGEHIVMTEIMRSSIPTLVGWTAMLDAAELKNMEDAKAGVGKYADKPFDNYN
ncbi:predicted protein [Phaeodactylum tricornutum CCAP 1055/1]|jgi:hypothetical protein|uniref:Uncharacterized protein n=1 Tax=Phaeodactylum tricornutum (strain CCAP 1055/1) TaxID=556484 RepID=B7FQ09_PHATC|nr:predicted protein [Phaeodactylum tricornutum CCAP 1055/1]EEC51772.1 predicted protein [Phaeodactylum tricornutum CCAP 1055/1]|eukprot:XP_002177309.1 predicted protein [Phaeodactylum tricornutum CCAP 1055/1]